MLIHEVNIWLGRVAVARAVGEAQMHKEHGCTVQAAELLQLLALS
jgi:hypothetical protein